jgi:hypothetical protein
MDHRDFACDCIAKSILWLESAGNRRKAAAIRVRLCAQMHADSGPSATLILLEEAEILQARAVGPVIL